MAVYTDVNEEELSSFLTSYPVGDLLSYKGIAEGTENSNYLLHTTGGSFILTLYEKRVNADDLPFFLGLMQHLAQSGVECPLPVARQDGALVGQLAGRHAALITFLEGMWLRKPAAVHCRAVGAALANLHIAGSSFPMARTNSMGVPEWHRLWEGSREEADTVEPGLREELDREMSIIDTQWPGDLPSGIVHADLFPDNVFFLGDQVSGLIDFYFACNDAFAYDIAICLNAWCFEKDFSFNLTKGVALLAGYQSVRPLEEIEVEALPVLVRGAALRFQLSRLYDWLNIPDGPLVKKRDPLEYMRKLRAHRHIRSAKEYGWTPVASIAAAS
ncbi:homoserine kinase [Limoniibacter endophyticus]|uniref:Homoserine kinase n=1 Tax=Limoniibacter endophyticus TaxID=1565040 RepID=A0A8J3DQB5_9HYPH|nr:homoserine kinase [Limoniibacter endophyticus]GHC71533.1 homoserine kinase [Limoniibacter endophyticus]